MSRLVPDEPGVDGWYWLGHPNLTRREAVLWHSGLQEWMDYGSPEQMDAMGYTFATIDGTECRHPIPGPAALEALHALPDQFKREAREGSEGVQPDYRLIAICTAQADAAMLRAALETKETT